jgi:hypothetical protein
MPTAFASLGAQDACQDGEPSPKKETRERFQKTIGGKSNAKVVGLY